MNVENCVVPPTDADNKSGVKNETQADLHLSNNTANDGSEKGQIDVGKLEKMVIEEMKNQQKESRLMTTEQRQVPRSEDDAEQISKDSKVNNQRPSDVDFPILKRESIYDVEKNTNAYLSNDKSGIGSVVRSESDHHGKGPPPDDHYEMQTEEERKRRPSEKSNVSRGNWGSKWEFLLSCVGLSVGIGNIWRFPYLAYKNGGGAFLIPYLIMLLLAGKPMYFMELAFGQFASKGPLSIWKCAPISKGVGVAMVIVCFIICIYYNILMAYTVYYIASSFQAEVPWMKCNPEWADMNTCEARKTVAEKQNMTILNSTANPLISNVDNLTSFANYTPQTPSQQYWERYVLGLSDGIEHMGGVKWDLALCLLLSWIVVVLCLLKGIKTSGKVVYFAATFPYIILVTLLIAGLLQEGAMKGVLYFLTPQWSKLLEIKVWKEAAGQMFFSLSVSMGSLIMYSSYNPFRNNVYRDAMVVSILDTFTSVIAGIVIFSVLGSMSHDLDVPIEQVVKSGPGLAFVAYPEALSRLPIPQLWSVLFFLMLFILGLDSEFANFENIITSISDEFPVLRQHKTLVCIVTAIVCFFLGLPCVTNGGQYVFQIMDDYGGSTSLIFVAVAECVGIMWIYGIRNFSNDVKFMLGSTPSMYLKVTWVFFSPVILATIFIYSMITFTPQKYGDSYTYPGWANVLGWMLALVSMIQIPIFAIIAICKQPGPTLLAKIRQSCQPDPAWGPADPEEKKLWLAQNGVPPTRGGLKNSTSFDYFNARPPVSAISYGERDNPVFSSSGTIPISSTSSFNNTRVVPNGQDNPAFTDNEF